MNTVNAKTLSSLPEVKSCMNQFLRSGQVPKIKITDCHVDSTTNLAGNVGKAVEVGIRILNSEKYDPQIFFSNSIEQLRYHNLTHDELYSIEEKIENKQNVTSLEIAQLSVNLINDLYIKQYGAESALQILYASSRMIKEVEKILHLYRSKGPCFKNGSFNVNLSIKNKIDAEADLIMNDELIEIKTIASKGFQKAHFYQTLIYFILAKNLKKFKRLRYFSIYLTRQNQLIRFDSEEILNKKDLAKILNILIKKIEEDEFNNDGEFYELSNY